MSLAARQSSKDLALSHEHVDAFADSFFPNCPALRSDTKSALCGLHRVGERRTQLPF
jgi:hypothetical protein